jgi:hypothetical protein
MVKPYWLDQRMIMVLQLKFSKNKNEKICNIKFKFTEMCGNKFQRVKNYIRQYSYRANIRI